MPKKRSAWRGNGAENTKRRTKNPPRSLEEPTMRTSIQGHLRARTGIIGRLIKTGSILWPDSSEITYCACEVFPKKSGEGIAPLSHHLIRTETFSTHASWRRGSLRSYRALFALADLTTAEAALLKSQQAFKMATSRRPLTIVPTMELGLCIDSTIRTSRHFPLILIEERGNACSKRGLFV